MKTLIPCTTKSLITENDVKNRALLVVRQRVAEKYFYETVDLRKSERTYKPGDVVVFRDSLADKIWRQAEVVRQSKPRSYDIQNSAGRILNCNSKILLPDKSGKKLCKQLEEPLYRSVVSTGRGSQPSVGTGRQSPSLVPTAPIKSTPTPVRRSSRIQNIPRVNYKE